MMSKIVKRGYIQSDEKEFGLASFDKLKSAGTDLYYLLNQGYHIKGAAEFVGNHYLLSARQRLALVRSISSKEDLKNRREKEILNSFKQLEVNIDGFNTIITLEVALSGSLLLRGLDGALRDMAGIRGSYHIIDKTERTIDFIGQTLEKLEIKKANFYLDAPVSNSGKLREYILSRFGDKHLNVEVHNINNVDSVLESLDNVITSDAIILDRCKSWINFNDLVMKNIDINKKIYIDFNELLFKL